MSMKSDIAKVFKILHDSFIEQISIKDKIMRFTLGAEFLANKLDKDHSYLFLEFINVSAIQFEDWSDNKYKYEDLNSFLKFAKELWFIKGEFKDDGKVYIHGHGGNSPDDTSCGGTISFKSDNYKILKEDGSILSLVELKKAYRLYMKEMQ